MVSGICMCVCFYRGLCVVENLPNKTSPRANASNLVWSSKNSNNNNINIYIQKQAKATESAAAAKVDRHLAAFWLTLVDNLVLY